MPNYLVTGANRGLGLGLVKVLASDPFNTVIGLVRNEQAAQDALGPEHDRFPNVFFVVADITDLSALKLAAQRTEIILAGDGLDVVINNAAFMGDAESLKTLEDFEGDAEGAFRNLLTFFDINVIGVLKTVYGFLPLVKKGNMKKFIAISTGMGNIDFINKVGIGETPGYAMSKNSLTVLMAKLNATYADQGILFASICPGYVDTFQHVQDMPQDAIDRFAAMNEKLAKHAPPQTEAVDPISVAKRVLAAIEQTTLEGGYGGTFLRPDGTNSWV